MSADIPEDFEPGSDEYQGEKINENHDEPFVPEGDEPSIPAPKKDPDPICEHFIPRRTFLQSPIVQVGLVYVALRAIEAWVTVKKLESGRA